jgi:hypothetical protein
MGVEPGSRIATGAGADQAGVGQASLACRGCLPTLVVGTGWHQTMGGAGPAAAPPVEPFRILFHRACARAGFQQEALCRPVGSFPHRILIATTQNSPVSEDLYGPIDRRSGSLEGSPN